MKMTHFKIIDEKFSNYDESLYFSDIYSIVINRFINFIFIPELDFDFSNWPPENLCSYDDIQLKSEARLYAVLDNQYCVIGTPKKDLLKKGSIKLERNYIDNGKNYSYSHLLFFIPVEELNEITKEIKSILDDLDFTEDRMNPEGFKNFAVGKRINKILQSKYFEKTSLNHK